MDDPLFDLDVEHHAASSRSSSCCAARTRTPSVVYTSTRQLFGKPRYLPVDEDHPVAPVDVNGITKYATEQLHLLYHDVYGLRASRGAAHQRVRAAPAPARRLPGLPADLRPPCARRRGDHACSATARRSATASTSTTSSSACCSPRSRPTPPGEIFNVGNDEHLVAARDRRRVVARGGLGPRRARAVAARSRRHRHRLVLRRLVEGEAHARLGAARRRSPTASRRTLAFYRASAWYLWYRVDRRPARSRSSTSRAAPRRSSPSSSEAIDRVAARRARYLLGPELEAFEAEFAAFTGRRHAVGVASGTDALRLALVALGVGAGRRGDRARVHRGADRGRRVRGRRDAGVRRRRPATPRRSTPRRRGAAVTDRTRAVIPVHLYGRPARIPDLGVPVLEDAAQAHGALDPAVRLGRGRVQLLSDEEPRWHRRRRRGGHRRRRRSRRRSACCAHARRHATDYVHDACRHATPACPRSRRPRCGSGCVASRPTTRAAREIAARYRDAAPGLRWQAPHAATCTTCASRGSPTATPSGARLPFETGVHYPRALTQQPAYQRVRAARRAPKPRRGRRSAYRCRASPR